MPIDDGNDARPFCTDPGLHIGVVMLYNVRALHQVMQDIKLSRPQLDELIHQRLREVLISAYRHVPHYRESMKSVRYDPTKDYRGVEDLAWLPITTREDFKQKQSNHFMWEGYDISECFCEHSSGSTGIPLAVHRTPSERGLQIAKWLRVLFLNGYSVRDKVLSFSNALRFQNTKKHIGFIQRLGLLRRQAVDYTLPPAKLADILLDSRPNVLYGNRSHLDLVALELKRRGITAEGLKLVVGTGEVISDSSRSLFRETFGVELLESYGSVEMGVMAYETPEHDGLHLCEDLTYFQFLDEENNPVAPGEPGRVVVTDLTARLMPFIRYEHSDFVVFKEAENKEASPLRRLTKIVGRNEGFISLCDGTKRSSLDLTSIVQSYSQIFQYQIIQVSHNLFQLLVVADSAYLKSIHDQLLRKLNEKLLKLARFQIFQVDRIEPAASGKTPRLILKAEK